MRSRLLLVLRASTMAFLVVASPRRVRAASVLDGACPPSARPVVLLVVAVAPPDAIIASTLGDHLRAELATRQIDVCSGDLGTRRPIARVELRVDHPARGPVLAIVRIVDAVTDKLVERTLDLTAIPADGRPLAVASSTDELLRASWVELSVAGAPPPAMTPPAAVLQAVASSLRIEPSPPAPTPASALELGASLAASELSGHRTAFGPAAEGRLALGRRLALRVLLGADRGLTVASEHGSVRADDLAASAALAWTVTAAPAGPWGLDIDAGAAALVVRFSSQAEGQALSVPATDFAALGLAGVTGWRRVGRGRLSLGVAGLVVLRTSRGRDEGQTVTAIEGGGGQLRLGGTFGL